MKILQVNNVYGFGSTGKISRDIHRELHGQGLESVVYYGRRNKSQDKDVHKLCSELYAKANNLLSRFTGLMYGGCHTSTNRLIRAIKKEKPDIVHLQCLNGYFVNIYQLIGFLNKKHIPTVLTLHAEFMYTANCGYAFECEKWRSGCGNCPRLKQETSSIFLDRTSHSWQKMKKAFNGFECISVIGVSEWITKRARESGMFQDANEIECIHNGIDLSNFDYIPDTDDKIIAAEYGLCSDRKIVLHVTSSLYSQYKGGKYFIELADRLKNVCQCVVVGAQAIEDKPEITCIPFINDQRKLAALYRLADVMVITSTAENYPTVSWRPNPAGLP